MVVNMIMLASDITPLIPDLGLMWLFEVEFSLPLRPLNVSLLEVYFCFCRQKKKKKISTSITFGVRVFKSSTFCMSTLWCCTSQDCTPARPSIIIPRSKMLESNKKKQKVSQTMPFFKSVGEHRYFFLYRNCSYCRVCFCQSLWWL